MAKEIERKFLVNGDHWRSNVDPGSFYRQGYLTFDEARSVRIRVSGNKAWINVKGKISRLSRHEYEYAIPAQDAQELLENLCLKPLIEKTRYRLVFSDLVWEIDEFNGANSGLIIAEVELQSEEQEFESPQWLGKEVSHDPRYLNINLVKHPYSNW